MGEGGGRIQYAVVIHMEKPPFVQKGSEWRSKRAYHPLKRSSDDVNGCVVMYVVVWQPETCSPIPTVVQRVDATCNPHMRTSELAVSDGELHGVLPHVTFRVRAIEFGPGSIQC